MAETLHLYFPTVSRSLFPPTLSMHIGSKEGKLVRKPVLFTVKSKGLQNVTAFPFRISEPQMGLHNLFPAVATVIGCCVTLKEVHLML